MCHTSRSLPRATPLAWRQQSEGVVELDYTLALAKATTLRDGVHYSTNGAHSFAYPLGQGWVRDPRFEAGSHSRCLRFATTRDASRGHLSSYGSHRLITLPSKSLYSGGTSHDGKCWHDGATLPVCCLARDAGDDPSVLDAPEFWAEMRVRYGGEFEEGLYRKRTLLPEVAVPSEPAPLDLEWLGKMRQQVSLAAEQRGVMAWWVTEGWDTEVTVLLHKVAQGWWLENSYPIELQAGQQKAQATLCEDEEYGLYFYLADRAFGRLLTGEDRPVSLATPVAAQVVEYLEHVPGRWAMPPRPHFPPVQRRRLDDSDRHARAIRRAEETLMPSRTAFGGHRADQVAAHRGA